MPTSIPVFVVEGHLEHNFIRDNCGKNIKVLKISNGESVSADALAKQVHFLLNALPIDPSHVIVLADLESRKQSSIDFENSVAAALGKLKARSPFSIHAPDKMIENWIIADEETMQTEGLNVELSNGAEGCGGKGKLRDAFKAKGLKYSETSDGPRLLKKCFPSRINLVSPSFSRFHVAASAVVPTCHWLKK